MENKDKTIAVNLKINSWRIIVQGVFLAGALAVAETSVILPVVVNYFSDSNVLVGLFSSLLRGGAILMQLYAAFHAQSHRLVLPQLKRVFWVRYLSWTSIGVFIFLFGTDYPVLTLFLFSLGLFTFSFSAGFGAIYYQELMAKSFSKEFRGGVMAKRQFFSGLISIVSVLGISGLILDNFPQPYNFSYLFLISGLIMAIGFLYFIPFQEIPKQNISEKDASFGKFIRRSFAYLRSDLLLRRQVISRLLSYSFLFSLPFIILEAKNNFTLSGKEIALMAALQMLGAMLSNFLWGRLSGKNLNKSIVLLSFVIAITALLISLLTRSIVGFYITFFLLGAAVDGFRLSYGNLILIVSPEAERPAYVAIFNNITSLGLFYAIPGGAILDLAGYSNLIIFTVFLLIIGLIYSLKLRKYCEAGVS